VGLIRRFAYGPVLGITPFNFPLNLVAHKVAPSLAVGAPIVVKPASSTPLGSLRLAELFDETDLPHGMFQVLPVSSKVADGMARDERFRKISFTGSSDIGWYLKGLDPKKRVTLELGGNAGVIVHSDADLDLAAQRVAFGGYYQAGQSCISVQRVLVQSEVYDDFAARLVKQIESLKVGDPMDPTVDVGPVIQRSEVGRIDSWVQEAVSQGATVLTGGRAEEPFYLPTLIGDVRPEMKVCREEIFGPVVTISPYQTFDDAIATVNDSRYGLQAGVFTNDINRAFQAHRDIDVGGVIVNDVSAFRADQMPYGGSKDSGFGREGLRYAMEEMTEPRIMVLSHVPALRGAALPSVGQGHSLYQVGRSLYPRVGRSLYQVGRNVGRMKGHNKRQSRAFASLAALASLVGRTLRGPPSCRGEGDLLPPGFHLQTPMNWSPQDSYLLPSVTG
jgi:acyl-CoA reductase-like NAD-dependent aldehyde dehydrogenase